MKKFEVGDKVKFNGSLESGESSSEWRVVKVSESLGSTMISAQCTNCESSVITTGERFVESFEGNLGKPLPEVDMVKRAKLLARKYHKGQKYGNKSYSYHLKSVVRLVEQCYKDHPNLDVLIQIAWLHDIIEDTEITFKDLTVYGFSPEVVSCVIHLSKADGQMLSEYLDTVKQRELALKVKICDTIANLQESCSKNMTKRMAKYSNQLKVLCEEN